MLEIIHKTKKLTKTHEETQYPYLAAYGAMSELHTLIQGTDTGLFTQLEQFQTRLGVT